MCPMWTLLSRNWLGGFGGPGPHGGRVVAQVPADLLHRRPLAAPFPLVEGLDRNAEVVRDVLDGPEAFNAVDVVHCSPLSRCELSCRSFWITPRWPGGRE